MEWDKKADLSGTGEVGEGGEGAVLGHVGGRSRSDGGRMGVGGGSVDGNLGGGGHIGAEGLAPAGEVCRRRRSGSSRGGDHGRYGAALRRRRVARIRGRVSHGGGAGLCVGSNGENLRRNEENVLRITPNALPHIEHVFLLGYEQLGKRSCTHLEGFKHWIV